MDVKAWRRGVMSDNEAYKMGCNEPMGAAAVLDEFVRRLGEMRSGRMGDGSSPSHLTFHEYGLACDKWPACRPAVLFVQPEKVTQDCSCHGASADPGCCRFQNGSPCCVCHSGDRSCLKCGRQPDPNPLTDRERIEKALRAFGTTHVGHDHPCPACDAAAILRGDHDR